jgi:NAD(P)-dependent dehydrogenase (short-subunit alcohol dehydrogenase family)
MTFSLGEVLGPDVRVNALKPGYIAETGLDSQAGEEPYRIERASQTAMNRLGLPSDVGGAAVFLASDLASYVTSEALLVDGGWVHVGGP